MKHTAFYLLLFTIIPCVLAQNVTITKDVNVSIVCGNNSQCVAITNSGPTFFTGDNQNTTIPVALSFSYEPNVTIVQNVTVIQNVTNVTVVQNVTNITVETQNVTVEQCNPGAGIINVSTTEIVNSISNGLITSCSQACKTSDTDRQALVAQANDAKAQLQIIQSTCDGKLTSAQAAYDSQLNITSQAVGNAENERNSWIYVSFIALAIVLLWIGIQYRHHGPPKIPMGPGTGVIVEPPTLTPEELASLAKHENRGMRR